MNRRTLPLSALRAFESAGRHANLGRAGEDLGVTHGAISHQIRALEEHLGVKLFNREHKRLKLTDAGERLYAAVEDGFNRIIDGVLHLDPDSLTGKLFIGCTQATAASWAISHINDFQISYPSIEIHLLEIKPTQKEVPREIDVAICYGEPSAGDRKVTKLASPPLYPVCNPRLLHGKLAVTRPEHITSLPLLHDGQNSWSNWFAAMGVPESGGVRELYFYSTNLSQTAARLGYGVALCNPFEIQDDLSEGRLIKLLERAVPESHDYFVLSDQPERQSLKARLFEEWILNAVKDHSPY